ncbi:hypothetical protein JKP88DRAFT_285490 [Tribonema minus]|uniref:Calponin-homology (CH) domain-containing protein n=1 Tax=Tribonema minus TaxID=303371 RepID=A0A835ZH20_9STRA|nr:hypothetical protein JKP88DRAFT_285490 [Tribonema minus]
MLLQSGHAEHRPSSGAQLAGEAAGSPGIRQHKSSRSLSDGDRGDSDGSVDCGYAGGDKAASGTVAGYARGAIKARMRRPRLTLRRLRHHAAWLNSLALWPRELTPASLAAECRDGLLLCRVLEAVAGVRFRAGQLCARPLSRGACVANLEAALGAVWRGGARANNARIPRAEDLYDAAERGGEKLHVLLEEILEVFVMAPLRAAAPAMLRWYSAVLRHYGQPLPPAVIAYSHAGLWRTFQSGTPLFLVLHHFFGEHEIGGDDPPVEGGGSGGSGARERLDAVTTNVPRTDNLHATAARCHPSALRGSALSSPALVAALPPRARATAGGGGGGSGGPRARLDARALYARPRDLAEHRVNVAAVFELLRAARVPVLFDVQDWLTAPDAPFLLLQLALLHRALERLPRAKACGGGGGGGGDGAVAVRAGGGTAVRGLRFADDGREGGGAQQQQPQQQQRRRVVRLGDGSGMSLWAPPLVDGGVALGAHRLPGLVALQRGSVVSPRAHTPRSEQLTPRRRAAAQLRRRLQDLDGRAEELALSAALRGGGGGSSGGGGGGSGSSGGVGAQTEALERERRAVIAAYNHVIAAGAACDVPYRSASAAAAPPAAVGGCRSAGATILLQAPPDFRRSSKTEQQQQQQRRMQQPDPKPPVGVLRHVLSSGSVAQSALPRPHTPPRDDDTQPAAGPRVAGAAGATKPSGTFLGDSGGLGGVDVRVSARSGSTAGA